MFFSFKKLMCAFLCATLLLTTSAQAGLWSSVCNFFSTTQNRVVAAAAVVGLAAISYYLFANKSGAEKQAKKKAGREMMIRENELFQQIVGTVRSSEPQALEKFRRLIQEAHAKGYTDVCQWANEELKTIHMFLVEKLDKNWLCFSKDAEVKKLEVNAKNVLGKSLLMYAVHAVKPSLQKDAVAFIEGLIDKSGADVLATDNYGNTVLHYAAQTGCVDLVKLILRKMIEKDPSKNPLLHRNALGLTTQDIGKQKLGSNQESTFKKNYVEVLVYLQNTVFDSEDGRIRQSRALTLGSVNQII